MNTFNPLNAGQSPAFNTLWFSKMHGAGNDFVMLDLRHGQPTPSPKLAAFIADRHKGVGCDQIITIENPRSPHSIASYQIWNADGSRSQQCGNGARCVAAWLLREDLVVDNEFYIDSPAGTHAVWQENNGLLAIDMGIPRYLPADIPLHPDIQHEPLYHLDYPTTNATQTLTFSTISMGNPHAVIEVPSVENADIAAIGSFLQKQSFFPESVNVGFAEVISPEHIRLRVFERGVGETLACGSGACAAVAALILRKRVGNRVLVSLPGGDLVITWQGENTSIKMSGPASFVFEGQLLLQGFNV